MRRPYKLFVLVFVPLLVLVTSVLFFLEQQERRSTLETIRAQEARRVSIGVQFMTRDFAPLVGDLMILANADVLKEYLASPSEANRDELANFFRLFSRERRTHDQIRLLGPDGLERVRVDYADGKAVDVPSEHLEDKSHRYYFQEAVKLRPGGIFVSPLDLNIERDRIERPFKPMLRFAAPVHGPDGRLAGVVVLNYLASVMLNRVGQRLEEAPGEAMVLNAEGRILVSRSGRHDWGFMWGDRWSFAEAYRAEWQRLRGRTGMFISAAGLFTFASAYPLLGVEATAAGRTTPITLHTIEGRDPGQYFWTVLSHIDRERLDARVAARSQDYIPFYLAGVVMTALLSLSYAYLRINRERRRESERLAGRVMEVSRDGVVITDGHHRILQVNHAFTDLTGFYPGEVVGKEMRAFHADRHGPEEAATRLQEMERDGYWRGETWMRRRDGTRFAASVTISPLGGPEQGPSNYVEIFSDITDHKEREAALTRQAQYDALTGLPNRHLFVDRLEMALAAAARHDDRVALLFVDLDKFKPINDTWGHEAGDRVLCKVAERLLRVAHRQSDTVARLGGDEFVVLLADVDTPERARAFAREVESVIARPMNVLVGEPVRVNASVGVAVYPDEAADAQALVVKADQAMYRIKRER